MSVTFGKEEFGVGCFAINVFYTAPFSIVSLSKVGSPSTVINTILSSGVLTDSSVGEPITLVYIPNDFFAQLENDIQDNFLNSNEFADSQVLYTYKNGESFVLNAIFDNEYFTSLPNSEVGIMSREPVLITQTNKFENEISKGDKVNIRGTLYKVKKPEPDGTGITVIYLQLD